MADDDIIRVLDRRGIKLLRIRTEALLHDRQVEAFGTALAEVAEVPGQRVVLSFLGVEHLTSQALGKLIQAHKDLEARGGELRLADIDPRIYDVFSITRLDKLFQIYEREEEALESFSPEAEA